jgi:hypothetical protein
VKVNKRGDRKMGKRQTVKSAEVAVMNIVAMLGELYDKIEKEKEDIELKTGHVGYAFSLYNIEDAMSELKGAAGKLAKAKEVMERYNID